MLPDFNKPKVGSVRGSVRFGNPSQSFKLGPSKPPTTVYVPMEISDPRSSRHLPPPNINSIIASRQQCFPNASQYIDDGASPLKAGNYQVRFIPIGEELVNDDYEDNMNMDMDSNANVEKNQEFKWEEIDTEVSSTLTRTMDTPFPMLPQKSIPPPPPVSQNPDDHYELSRPPSAPCIHLSKIIVDEIVLTAMDQDYLVICYHTNATPPEEHRICKRDLEVFKEGELLDDTVINYYIHLITRRSRQKNRISSGFLTVYGFSCSFYPLLESSGGLELVAQSANGVNIFNFDLILFPVCVNNHWLLVAADNRTKKVTAYNSLRHIAVKQILNNIMRYLKKEYQRVNPGNDLPKKWNRVTNEDNENIPQQNNALDCGVFILQFAEYLSRGQPFDFGQEHMRYFRAKNLYECISGRLITN